MVKVVLEPGLQVHGVPGSAKRLRQLNNREKVEVWKPLGERDYATVERQSLYDDHILALCHGATLNAWDRTEEVGKKIESFTKVIQVLKENFHGFLTKIDISRKRIIPNSEVRQIIIESSAFENVNSQC